MTGLAETHQLNSGGSANLYKALIGLTSRESLAHFATVRLKRAIHGRLRILARNDEISSRRSWLSTKGRLICFQQVLAAGARNCSM